MISWRYVSTARNEELRKVSWAQPAGNTPPVSFCRCMEMRVHFANARRLEEVFKVALQIKEFELCQGMSSRKDHGRVCMDILGP